ncbi:MBL fold metallo-hydrolase, partial [Desulfitobacterium sp.]|uniref:MBL fold metallo-hydrolase n=1 Tax=Desulfitobacterium sp. TaxID=49981 RepID=UPI002BC9E25C
MQALVDLSSKGMRRTKLPKDSVAEGLAMEGLMSRAQPSGEQFTGLFRICRSDALAVSRRVGKAALEASEAALEMQVNGCVKSYNRYLYTNRRKSKMEIHFHGHSCFEIEGNEGRVLIDPFLTGNPMADIRSEDIKSLDGILVSHGHSDHLGDAIEISKRTGAPIIGVYELARLCERAGAKTHAMHIGGKHQFSFGMVRLTQ